MKKGLLLIFALLCCVQQSCSSNDSIPQNDDSLNNDENVIFMDDFKSFNSANWTKEVHNPGWTNQELQAYDVEHVKTGKDGDKTVLIITAERKGNKIYSGRINSKGKKSFKYGTIEASIKLPKTNGGLWPAFWMMGDNDKNWPQCGEIDIMEMGEKNGIDNGTSDKLVNTALHYGTDASSTGHKQEYYMNNFSKDLQDGNYHKYSLVRSEDIMTVYIDDVKFYSFNVGQSSDRFEYFNGEFYILFNLAVGGSFTGITDINKLTALKDGEKVSMYIDWIKVLK